MKDPKSHIVGELETAKFAERKARYDTSVQKILNLGHEKEDYLHHFGAFVGELTLLRAINLMEAYFETKDIPAHIAEVGCYKGGSTLLFGKLVKLFEPHALTMVHGFDWFQGTTAEVENPLQVQSGNSASEEALRLLIAWQELYATVKVHKLDAEKDFPAFFEKRPHLRFKLVFIDSGTYPVVSESIKAFWPRLLPGGIMIFDQFCSEVAPGETRAVCEFLPHEKIEAFSPGWMPNAFVRKK